MLPAEWHAAWTAIVVAGLLGMLTVSRYPVDLLFVTALTALILAGVLEPSEAFAGLSNSGFLTVAVLYVVVAGVRDTGGVQWIVQNILGRPASLLRAQARVTLPVAGFSAFLNNTPVVAMMIPAISEWARRFSLSESRLFLPLSYAAILGGTCTLIGTSTNLVVAGLLSGTGSGDMGLFTITPVGVVVLITGFAFLFTVGRRLLPDRDTAGRQLDNPREYTVEMTVVEGPLEGRTVEEAGLRHLPNCFLVEIDRDDNVLPAVSPRERLRAGDRLVFAGSTSAVLDLRRIRGLSPPSDSVFQVDGGATRRQLVEAVVSEQSPAVGRSIRDSQFRNRYGAVVIAVARGSERLPGKIGDIVLQPGDVLMLEAGPDFLRAFRFSRDFLLTRRIEDSERPRHERFGVAACILGGMVGLAAFGVLPILEAALAAAVAMIATRCVSLASARAAMDWTVLVTIAAAFGVSAAIEQTGLAAMLGDAVFAAVGESPWAALAAAYALTAGLSAIVTNNAAAVLTFPIAISVANHTGMPPTAMALAIMFGASASFATPVSYQTNLMVMGAGGYRFGDYVRVGLPLTLVTGAAAVFMIGAFYT